MALRSASLLLEAQALGILTDEHPMTLRQLYYRLVSAGILRNDQKEYKRLGHVMTRSREAGDTPRAWIVDHIRSTLKPSSWTGLADFAETVRDAYRKDFWAGLPHHVEILVEKDAVAGTLQPVTEEFDIRLRVCRGYSSISFAGEIADLWGRVEKPIFACYIGDFDPSGFDLERDLREKLKRYTGRPLWSYEGDGPALEMIDDDNRHVYWTRLGVVCQDFDAFDLVCLPVKEKDMRARGFIQEHGHDCAEVDALPPSELRRRVREAIERHIDPKRWARLRRTEAAEQETLKQVMDGWRNGKLT
jgi:hypothetical protein